MSPPCTTLSNLQRLLLCDEVLEEPPPSAVVRAGKVVDTVARRTSSIEVRKAALLVVVWDVIDALDNDETPVPSTQTREAAYALVTSP